MFPNVLTTSEIGSKIIAQKNLKFYKSSKTNKDAYLDEPKLNAKLHIWFKKIMGLSPLPKFANMYWKKVDGYTQAAVDLALSTYRDLLFEFLDTPISDIDYKVFNKRFLLWNNKAERTYSCHKDDTEKEVDPMEQASKELLMADDIFGYID
jgi:hypothetical protein